MIFRPFLWFAVLRKIWRRGYLWQKLAVAFHFRGKRFMIRGNFAAKKIARHS